MLGSRRHVAVVGPAEASERECATAHEIGRLLALLDVVVVTGGLGGVMAAAIEGCRSAGGVSLGVLPGSDRPGRSSVEIPTGLGEMRNALVVRSADALIAVGGSWGTLSEIALARRTGIPVVCVGGWSVADAHGAPVDVATEESPASAVEWVLSR
jgi:uncharacterized protein (TIGR00725 family)